MNNVVVVDVGFVVVGATHTHTHTHTMSIMMMMSRNITKRLVLTAKRTSFHARCPPPVRPYHCINQASFSSSSSAKFGFVGWCLRKLETHPIVTKGITSSLIFTAADFTSQRDVPTTLKKIFMRQAVFGPVINTVFFTYNGAVQAESGPEVIARLKRDLLPTLLGGALFWPVCDFVTFKFIPVHLQPLVKWFLRIFVDHLFSIHGELKK